MARTRNLGNLTDLLTAGSTYVTTASPPLNDNSQNLATTAWVMGQVSGVVGSTRNLAASLLSAATSLTVTADEIIVETSLGGPRYCIGNFNKTLNVTTTGAGGMDTGSAPTSGFVGIYAIYNPSSNTSALLATNATSTAAPNVYGGTSMPSGYTASALLAVWPTNSSAQLVAGFHQERRFSLQAGASLTLSTGGTGTINLATYSIPLNAKTVRIQNVLNCTGTSPNADLYFAPNSNWGAQFNQKTGANAGNETGTVFDVTTADVDILTPQSIYYNLTVGAGTVVCNVGFFGYTI
jgi:hypothetical protein